MSFKLNIAKELDMLEKELKGADELYNETKKHFDNVRSSKSNSTLTFVEKQTANLISLKSNKISIIKEIVNTKKIEMDVRLKDDKISNADNNTDAKYKEISSAIFDIIINNKSDDVSSLMNNTNNNETEMTEEDYDRLLEKRLADEKNKQDIISKEKEEEKFFKELRENCHELVCDNSKKIYCVDAEFELMEEVVIPKTLEIVKFIEEDDSHFGVDGKERRYTMVELT